MVTYSCFCKAACSKISVSILYAVKYDCPFLTFVKCFVEARRSTAIIEGNLINIKNFVLGSARRI